MLLGHYGVALAAKRAAPRTSFGTLIFGAQFLDTLWPVLVLAGVERVRVRPGLMEASPLEFVHYPYSHSLVSGVLLALIIGFGYIAVTRYRRGGWIVGLLVLSHWFLDLPMHRPDLPLAPGSDLYAGGGLWDSLAATLMIEYGLLALGALIYARTTRAVDRIGSIGLWAGLIVLAAMFAGSLFAPPPPDAGTVALGALILVVLIPWGWWVDRHRVLRGSATAGAMTA